MTMVGNTRRRQIVSMMVLLMLFILAVPAQAATVTRTSAFEYDPVSGLVTKEVIEPDSPELCLVTQYTYDAYGNKNSATTRNCNGSPGSHPGINSEAAAPATGSDAAIVIRTSTITYDTLGRFPISSTNALGHTETKAWNGDFDTVASLTGPNGLTTTWIYDSFGRVLTETRADGTSTATSYTLCSVSGANCPALAIYKISINQAGAPSKAAYFDMRDRAVRAETQGFDGTPNYADTKYDHLGHIAQTSRPYKAGGAPVWTTTTFDVLDRPVSVSSPDDSGANTTTTVAYSGYTTVVTNAKGQAKTEVKNSQGQLVSVTDAFGKTLTYAYDPFGNLVQTSDPLGNFIVASYDKRDRKTVMNDPDQGQWTYAYDVLGQLKRQADAKGQVVTFQYDKLNRMTSRNEPDLVSGWVYDVCDSTLNPAGKCVGRLVRETSDNGYVRTALYDTYGRATAEYDNIDSGYGVAKTYDSYGRVANLVYPTGLQTGNVYTAAGYLVQVKNASTQAVYWQANTLDAEGHVVSETYGNSLLNTRIYNANTGRMTQSRSGTASILGGVSDQSYVYDSLGNLTQRYDAVTGLNEAFGYDALNRLISTSAQVSSGPLTQVTVTYDDIGNIVTKSDVGSYTYGSGTDANGHVIHPHAVTKILMTDGVTQYAAYAYDANGNMLSGAGRTSIWTSWNMPSQITGTLQGKSTPNGTVSSSFAFVYNAEHERIKETLPDGTVVYNISPRVDIGIHVEKRVKTNGTVEYQNALYAGAFPFGAATTNAGGQILRIRYYHKDHLGSIVAITDESGNVAERRSYDAWGKRRNTNGTALANAFVTPDIRHGFTGHEELDDIGLIHMNGRLYDPAIGRFMSADPIVQYPDDLQSYNRYSYINNNPLSAIDPSGHGFFSSIFHAISSVVHAVTHAVTSLLNNTLVRTAASIAAAIYVPQLSLFGGNETLGALVGGFSSGLISGRGDLEAALRGAITAGVFDFVGDKWPSGWENVAAHAVVGCVSAATAGGRCESGALSGGFSAAAAPFASSFGVVGGTVASAVIGGTASVLGGGKFENGAYLASFGYLFNYCAHNGCWTTQEERSFIDRGDFKGYYQTACEGGDLNACRFYGISTGEEPGPSARLRQDLLAQGYTFDQVDQLVKQTIPLNLAKDYANLLPQSESAAAFPSAQAITDYHWAEFGKYGLSPSTFGGTPFGKSFGVVLPGLWCPLCTK